MDWNKILNWKLLAGSHGFPGPDGGPCINEAAIVAAGFDYRMVISTDQMPQCFSRPICLYALSINDRMPDDLRQKLLMPFVTRLSGTADSGEVEVERTLLMVSMVLENIFPIAQSVVEKDSDIYVLAYYNNACKAIDEARQRLRSINSLIDHTARGSLAPSPLLGTLLYSVNMAAQAVGLCALACKSKDDKRRVWIAAVSILEEILKVGRHEVVDLAVACDRLEAAKVTV